MPDLRRRLTRVEALLGVALYACRSCGGALRCRRCCDAFPENALLEHEDDPEVVRLVEELVTRIGWVDLEAAALSAEDHGTPCKFCGRPLTCARCGEALVTVYVAHRIMADQEASRLCHDLLVRVAWLRGEDGEDRG